MSCGREAIRHQNKRQNFKNNELRIEFASSFLITYIFKMYLDLKYKFLKMLIKLIRSCIRIRRKLIKSGVFFEGSGNPSCYS